ncbi:MAG: hypothetical protein IT381_20785 [Deltaproteobacteria bacterium]|nr:hypothetical protein [Deltaproteobacteria bacterium]
MSGSSCAMVSGDGFDIVLDAGIRISWDIDSMEVGAEHHRAEEEAFTKQLVAMLPAIGRAIDEVKQRGKLVLRKNARNDVRYYDATAREEEKKWGKPLVNPCEIHYAPKLGTIAFFELRLHCDVIDWAALDALAPKIDAIVRAQLAASPEVE